MQFDVVIEIPNTAELTLANSTISSVLAKRAGTYCKDVDSPSAPSLHRAGDKFLHLLQLSRESVVYCQNR